MNGLHTCKPENAPTVGQVKNFVIEQRTAASGKAWTKIKSGNQDNPGTPHKILTVSPTGRTDQYGNVSFNLEIEPTDEQLSAPTAQNAQKSAPAPHHSVPMTKDDYWARKEDRDAERQCYIMRQHSQHMALLLAQVDNRCVMDDEGKFSTKKLAELISWFQRDINRAPTKESEEPY